jgi:hypothetical protein
MGVLPLCLQQQTQIERPLSSGVQHVFRLRRDAVGEIKHVLFTIVAA